MSRRVLLEVELGDKGPLDGRWPSPYPLDKVKSFYSLMGIPVYLRDGRAVHIWAVDGHIVCGDRCMLVFGPFDDEDQAMSALDTLRAHGEVWGGMCRTEHCFDGNFIYSGGLIAWPQMFYTDG